MAVQRCCSFSHILPSPIENSQRATSLQACSSSGLTTYFDTQTHKEYSPSPLFRGGFQGFRKPWFPVGWEHSWSAREELNTRRGELLALEATPSSTVFRRGGVGKAKQPIVVPDAPEVEKGKYSYDVENAINHLSSLAPRGSMARCMEGFKSKLSMHDFSLVFREFAQRGDWQKALRLFKYMQRHQWCKPNEHVYTIMIGNVPQLPTPLSLCLFIFCSPARFYVHKARNSEEVHHCSELPLVAVRGNQLILLNFMCFRSLPYMVCSLATFLSLHIYGEQCLL